jgi:hypothetical protein
MDNHLFIAGGDIKGEDGTAVLSYDLDTIESQWDKGPTSETRMTWERTYSFNAVALVQAKSIIDGFLDKLESRHSKH